MPLALPGTPSLRGARHLSKLLLILGPPGAGKTTLISNLCHLDSRFVYVAPYTTRTLRSGESDKVHVSDSEMDELIEQGDLLWVNALYGARYGTPRRALQALIQGESFPVLDWPITMLDAARDALEHSIVAVYLHPSNLDTLATRLARRTEDSAARLHAAQLELQEVSSGSYDHLVDLFLMSNDSAERDIAARVLSFYLSKSDSANISKARGDL